MWPRVLVSMLQCCPWAVCDAWRPTQPEDPVITTDPMSCPATVAHVSPATPADVRPVAAADASLMSLSGASSATPADASSVTSAAASLVAPDDVNMATVADASPMTVAVQSRVTRCQELVLWRAQRLAVDIANSPMHRLVHGCLDDTSLLP